LFRGRLGLGGADSPGFRGEKFRSKYWRLRMRAPNRGKVAGDRNKRNQVGAGVIMGYCNDRCIDAGARKDPGRGILGNLVEREISLLFCTEC